MDEPSHLERLENRLAVLEGEIRELRNELASYRLPSGSRARSAAAHPARPDPRVPHSLSRAGPDETAGSAAQTQKLADELRTQPLPKRSRDLEVWLGENALLVVGAAAMILASGFLIKYAFDRGWISPAFRVFAGVIGGMAVATYGERLHRKEMRRFGGALVGTGAGITYLALWAAAGPYGIISPEIGVLALLLVAGLVIASAASAGTEYLAAIACTGALLAPILLGHKGASPNLLVAYTGIVAASTTAVALPRDWRATVAVALTGYFLIPTALAPSAHPVLIVLYLVIGGAVALVFLRARGWRGLEGAAFFFAWFSVAVAATELHGGASWFLAVALPILVAPSFWAYAGRGEEKLSSASGEDALRDPPTVYFVLSALAWTGVTLMAHPGAPKAYYPLLLLAAISLPYLALGLGRRMLVPHAVAFGIAAWGVHMQFEGLAMTRGWGVLALVSAITTRSSPLTRNRWVGVALAVVAAYQLVSVDYGQIDAAESAFLGGWALTLYFLIAVLLALAGPLWGEPAETESGSGVRLRPLLWIAAGLTLLAGGTELILLYFDRLGAEGSGLVGNLTVSGFWLAYAGALLAFGFLKNRREVRIAGLAMTGLSIIKVALYDLTQLEALYRVASFFLLALIALGAAYAYHRRGRESGDAQSGGTS